MLENRIDMTARLIWLSLIRRHPSVTDIGIDNALSRLCQTTMSIFTGFLGPMGSILLTNPLYNRCTEM